MTHSDHPRTRFAPSPTGYLHIGGARTALFNFLFARHTGGTIVLRIEDTDRERSTDASINAILTSLRWLEIDWDEGPFFQSQRTPAYLAALERLLTEGKAYRCYCSAELLDAKRKAAFAAGRKPAYDGTCRDLPPRPGNEPHVIRFRGPKDGETVIDDLVKGRVVFRNDELDDLILLRTDGTPTYNFCVVVDDVEMRISHVLRGDDHLANTPRQILMYQALGAPLPSFGHVPLILGPDKTRLSKRHGAMAVTAYRDMGFLSDAVVNYLVRLGWSHGDQEIFSRAELVERFSIESIGKSAGVFDLEKMQWLNGHYLRQLAPDDLARAVRPFIEMCGLPVPGDERWLAKAVATVRERAKTLIDVVDLAHFYLSADLALDPAAAAKFLKPPIKPALQDLRQALAGTEPWNVEKLTATFNEVIGRHGLALGKVAQPVRVAVTGTSASPGIFEVLDVLGRERTLARLDAAIASIA